MRASYISSLISILKRLFFLLLLFRSGNGSTNANESKSILFYMGCGSYSMRISIWPLVEALTEKGHRVTFLSAYESKSPHPGVFDYVPKKLQKWWTEVEHEISVFELRRSGMLIPFWFSVPQFGIEVCKNLYEDPDALKWIMSSKFDLVFIDSFFNDCAYGIAHVSQAKTIIISTTTVFPWFYDALGIPDDSSWAGADTAFAFPVKEMNIFQRTLNAVMPVLWKFIREWWYFPKLEDITRTALKLDNLPSFTELEKNTTLTFITTHYSQEFARAFPPNVIPIGGLAVTGKVEPLSKEIQDFINAGKHGFIYISFGTVGDFLELDDTIREEFVNGLLKFPNIQFIWKASKGIGVKLPKNFLILKWAPQQSLLAHPKIKAFITHAGLGGINEAIYYGAPMIAFPLFAEQDHNANLLTARGIGQKLEIINLKAHQLENAIKDITGTLKTKQKMLNVSRLFKDRPQSALQTSLWWTEYVLKYDTSELKEFLQPLNVNQPWWIRRQLDVWLIISMTMLLAISILLYAIKCSVISILRFFKRKSFISTNLQKAKRH